MPTLAARGVELAWSELGRGKPALLIHETAVDSSAWEPVAAALAGAAGAGGRALLYDRRGWGASSVPDGYRRTTIEEQSEDAAVLLERLEAVPATLAGAGVGAVIALDLLLRRPELVSGALLVEPPLLSLLPEATERLSADLDALAQASERGTDALVELYLSGGLGALGAGAERLPASLSAAARERPASLVAELGAVSSWGMPLSRLGEVTRPVLIITSESTPTLLAAAATALAERLGRGERRALETGALPAHLSDPGALTALAGGLGSR